MHFRAIEGSTSNIRDTLISIVNYDPVMVSLFLQVEAVSHWKGISEAGVNDFLNKTKDAWQRIDSVQDFIMTIDVDGQFSASDDGNRVDLAHVAAAILSATDLLGLDAQEHTDDFVQLPSQFEGFGYYVAAMFEGLGNSTQAVEGRVKLADYLVEVFSCLSNGSVNDFSVLGTDNYLE